MHYLSDHLATYLNTNNSFSRITPIRGALNKLNLNVPFLSIGQCYAVCSSSWVRIPFHYPWLQTPQTHSAAWPRCHRPRICRVWISRESPNRQKDSRRAWNKWGISYWSTDSASKVPRENPTLLSPLFKLIPLIHSCGGHLVSHGIKSMLSWILCKSWDHATCPAVLHTKAAPVSKDRICRLFDLYHFSVIKWPSIGDSFPFVCQVLVNKWETTCLHVTLNTRPNYR